MNTMGKILVWVNLAFSVVTAGLIIVVFAARTNWKAAYDKAVANQKVAEANAITYHEEAEETRRQTELERTKLADRLAQVEKEFNRAAAENKDWVARYQELEKLSKNFGVTSTGISEELARRASEVDQLKARVIDRDNKMLEMQKEKDDFRHRAVAAELNLKSEQDRNSQLLAEVERLHQASIAKAPAGGAGTGTTTARATSSDRYPPPEDVEGLVLEVDPQSSFLTISIGSDAGLRKNNTLEVYRLKPQASYLGTIQVLDVQAKKAVAKPIGNRRVTILPGDIVSSNILSKR